MRHLCNFYRMVRQTYCVETFLINKKREASVTNQKTKKRNPKIKRHKGRERKENLNILVVQSDCSNPF